MQLACIPSIVASIVPCDLGLVGAPMFSWLRDIVTWAGRVGAAEWAQTVVLSRLGVHLSQWPRAALVRPEVKLIALQHRLASSRGFRIGAGVLGIAFALSPAAAEGGADQSDKRRIATADA